MTCEVPADEVVFTPLHVGIFFALLTAVDGGGIAGIKAKLQQDYLSTLVTELVVWPGCGKLPKIPPTLAPHVAPRASAPSIGETGSYTRILGWCGQQRSPPAGLLRAAMDGVQEASYTAACY